MNLRGIVSSIKNNKGRILTSGVGVLGLGFIGYDAHYYGKIKSDLYASEKDAASAAYYLNNDMYVTSMSKTEEKVRDLSLKMELGHGWKRFINSAIGYVRGFFTMLISHVVPLGLSLGAIMAPGKWNKVCAGGLGLYGLYEFVKNFFGFGTPGSLLK